MKNIAIIKSFFFSLILMPFGTLDRDSNQMATNDYIFLDKILVQAKVKFPERTISLCPGNDNQNLISIIEDLKKCDLEKNSFKLDSLKQDIGITKEPVFSEIFNEKEYNYLISQKQNTEWDFKKINIKDITRYNKNDFTNKQVRVYVSKPIYTSNKKYALVAVSNSSSGYVLIFKKDKNNWKEFKMIDPWFS